jgi:hypothetical protein
MMRNLAKTTATINGSLTGAALKVLRLSLNIYNL